MDQFSMNTTLVVMQGWNNRTYSGNRSTEWFSSISEKFLCSASYCTKTFPKTTIRGNQKLFSKVENFEKLFGYAKWKGLLKTFPENTIRYNGFHQFWKIFWVVGIVFGLCKALLKKFAQKYYSRKSKNFFEVGKFGKV